jgi:tetratricopeptide (TPR) repeat protein
MAREAFNNRRYNEALQLLEASTRLDEDNVSSWSLLGRTLVRLGRFEDAIAPLTRGLELSQVAGNIHILLLNRTLSYYYLGNLGLALDDLNKILDDNPTHIEALRIRAQVWIRLGRLENALSDIDTALMKRPTYLCARTTKVVILKQQGKIQEAEEELKQCDAIKPDDSVDFYCLSLAYAHMGNNEESLKYLQTSFQHDPKCIPRALKDPLFGPLQDDPHFMLITQRESLDEKGL